MVRNLYFLFIYLYICIVSSRQIIYMFISLSSFWGLFVRVETPRGNTVQHDKSIIAQQFLNCWCKWFFFFFQKRVIIMWTFTFRWADLSLPFRRARGARVYVYAWNLHDLTLADFLISSQTAPQWNKSVHSAHEFEKEFAPFSARKVFVPNKRMIKKSRCHMWHPSWALIVVDSVLPDNNGRRLLSPHHNAAELAATEDKSVQFF